MTYIDFFVAAYYFQEGKNFIQIRKIIKNASQLYVNARLEYDAIKNATTVDELKEWIRDRLKGSYLDKFNSTYN